MARFSSRTWERLSRRPGRWAVLASALLAVGGITARALAASGSGVELTPESPEIQKAVARGIEFLGSPSAKDSRLGGKALIGLAILKATGEAKHPQIDRQAKEMVAMLEGAKSLESHDIYSLGIAIIFFANLDGMTYRPQLETLLAELKARQKPHGGWGYTGQQTGDTSMTQYAVLGMWEAERAGFDTPVESWEKVCNWLLRTQDPTGGFGYQGNDPGSFTRVNQIGVRHSLCAGGLASLYLCEDHLGLYTGSARRSKDLPSVLKKVEKPDKRRSRPRLTNNVDPKRLSEAQEMGAGWFDGNWAITPKTGELWQFYYLYALERYESFREAMNGLPESHDWYDEGARRLLELQQPSGGWNSTMPDGPYVGSAFSLLFLVRSTKKALISAGLGSGALVAGRGIPKTTSGLRMRGGDIVASPLNKPAEQLLSLMEDVDNPESVRAAEGFISVAEAADEATLNKHAVQLRKLAASEHPEARIAAVKGLGRARQLDNVPTLIYALTDPDSQVVTAAIEALRCISRQPPGSSGTMIADDVTRKAAIDYWKSWYLSIRPGADLSDLQR